MCLSMLPSLGGDDEVTCKEAFEKEVMILHRVGSHQHIIGLFGVCMQASELILPLALSYSLLCCRQVSFSNGVSLTG